MADPETKMGTLEKVFILHGWTYSTEKWEPFLTALKEKGVDAELLKIPGLTEKLESVWDINNYVEWLNKKVGNNKVILIGHSNGGRIILAFAIKYPEKIKKIFLIDSAGIYHNELNLRIKRFLYNKVAKIGKKILPSKSLRNLLYKIIGEGDYKNAEPLQKQTMINLISHDLTPQLHNIKTPTLITWGQNDTITPLSDGKLMHKLISSSKLEIIKDARHSPQFTHPADVIKIIYDNI